ncbi:group II intron maturase-specific domain-containing protein [Okeania sp. SIO2B3]|uniref:group II intron maturase-specific domain-containing protein n=1 Tax=Okeania sp. SIO2B3 TaxID=2607784 RepID=UPI0013BFF92C|nr:group II intron maturase-specific domain-containing protein [Okeania sp. SIO2B3]NET44423.1 group II intron reverse transcriptase/maturase [Okeania sp. SIO2B3]
MSNTSLKTTVEWEEWRDINWLKVERHVFKLQDRIYRASESRDFVAFRKPQKTLLKSWYAKLLAVRGVVQDNQSEKVLSSEKLFALAETLDITGKVKSRRGTMEDYALQILVKMALEPEWEAIFESSCYGFRPGRSPQDAVEAIFGFVKLEPKYVLEADIAKSSQGINYELLLEKLGTYPTLRRKIKAWLKAGVMDGEGLFPTEEQMARGGVISSLLANLALHGMEEQINEYAETFDFQSVESGYEVSRVDRSEYLGLVRYGSSLAIAHKDIDVVQKCLVKVGEWLSEMGLELKPSETRVVHTLYGYGGEKPGFDFLGFNIRQYEVGKNQCKLGFKTEVKPSDQSMRSHYRQIAEVIDRHKSAPQAVLIRRLNPIIRDWVNYYSAVVSKKTFRDLDHLIFQKLWRWARRRHSNKNNDWISQKYWHSGENRKEFSCSYEDGSRVKLLKHTEVPIVRQENVNKDWFYWSRQKDFQPLDK